MPTLTYPGVYIEEISSGVHTITGVATSITAFVGKALRGPVNEAIRVLSFTEFAKIFGGLSASSEMSYAVQQFFLNGGGQAWIVRIVKDPFPASVKNGLKNATPTKIFEVNAKYEGNVGNAISIDVDYQTRNPKNTFNLTVSYRPPGNPADAQIERFPNLSMRRVDKASTETLAANVVRRGSELIELLDVLDDAARKDATKATFGHFESAVFPDGPPKPPSADPTPFDFKTAVTTRSNQFQVQVNGLPAVKVVIDPAADTADGGALCASIQTQVRAGSDNDTHKKFTCSFTDKKIAMKSGAAGEDSRVEVLPGVFNDAFRNLKLGLGDGASQTDAVAILRPAAGTSVLEGGSEKDFTETEAPDLFIPPAGGRKGIYALDPVDLFNLLCLPGMLDPMILGAAATYCEKRRAFLIADSPGGNDASQVAPGLMEQTILGTSFPKTKNGAVFYPWIRVGDKLRPPSGAIAGLMARIDAQRGVWKAPAGTEANLANVQGLEYALTDDENGVLNPHGVNCIRLFPTYGIVAWGARTLVGDDAQASEWKYVPVRRTALFIEESLYRGTQWVVFEPNDEPLWAQIRLNIGAFMHGLFRQGAFQGMTPRDAYFVKCDKETTTQADINLGIVNIVVGFAPLKPAEFVVIKIQQMAGQIET